MQETSELALASVSIFVCFVLVWRIVGNMAFSILRIGVRGTRNLLERNVVLVQLCKGVNVESTRSVVSSFVLSLCNGMFYQLTCWTGEHVFVYVLLMFLSFFKNLSSKIGCIDASMTFIWHWVIGKHTGRMFTKYRIAKYTFIQSLWLFMYVGIKGAEMSISSVIDCKKLKCCFLTVK